MAAEAVAFFVVAEGHSEASKPANITGSLAPMAVDIGGIFSPLNIMGSMVQQGIVVRAPVQVSLVGVAINPAIRAFHPFTFL